MLLEDTGVGGSSRCLFIGIHPWSNLNNERKELEIRVNTLEN